MNIYLTCKLDSSGILGFLRPLADLIFVHSIAVFRYEEALPCPKVFYYKTNSKQKGYIGHIKRFFLMMRMVKSDMSLGIGIYEIPHGLLAFLIGNIKKIPVVISIIGNPEYNKLRKGLRKKITYFVLNKISAITVTGKRSKEFLLNDGINNVPIYIMPNSIDIAYFQSAKTEKKWDIISLGRLSPEKELMTLLKIIHKLKMQSNDIRCAIAGNGPEKMRLQEAIIQMGLSENVTLLGFIDDIVSFYNCGKIFLLTSSTEGLPRTVLEAMACGVPCVASLVGDIEDAIIDGRNGYLISKYHAIDEYADKIKALLLDKDKYEELSSNAESHIRNNYSYEAAGRVWREIITGIHGAL